MTVRTGEVAAALIAAAEAAADAADTRSGVRTRPARRAELGGVLARFESTWGGGRGADLATIQALHHAGNTVLVAVPASAADDERADAAAAPIGATLGFLGWTGGLHVHSHMNAVDPAARGRGIGVALKLRQRAVCLAHGVTEMRWTYDPLIRRNAHLNLVRLGAEVTRFLPDFYGQLDDAITGTDRSDRFEVRWRLDGRRTARALGRGPVPEWHAEGGLALAADFEALRAADPAAAARLRDESRAAFAVLGAGGLRADLDANGDYVFTRDDPDREA
ncbi:GNAT family N-acetyltransferase [Agromyces ramosus]|uniref:GNAT superfamily acetyltransferase n=1 Tax=Agromyces ramosus TaxID=33879 RepID=A0ABU0RAX3_9MICO|nr:GNAT family N-acetyltransferase [Agromyces ramosus]MDQ0895225.1 putative GNAT superfamily acetyltransferase [Agromyces ramosus]